MQPPMLRLKCVRPGSGGVVFASNIVQWVLLGGIIMVQSSPQLLLFGIVLVCCHYAFQLYNITGRDKRKQQGFSLVKQRRYNQCGLPTIRPKTHCVPAAYTYVVAALGSLATLLYYIMIFLGSRSRD